MSNSRKTSELAERVDGALVGDPNVEINSVADLSTATTGQIAYVKDEKFFESAAASKASCLLVPPGAAVTVACRIEVKRPKLAFALIAELLHPRKKRQTAIHVSAVVAASAEIETDVYIGPNVVIEEHARIGSGTRIEAGTAVGEGVRVGRDCVLYP